MNTTTILPPSAYEGVSYLNSKSGATVIALTVSGPKQLVSYIEQDEDGEVMIRAAKLSAFDADHDILHVAPAETALDILRKCINPKGKTNISTSALDQLEGIINMDTRGKSKDEIAAEVARVASELPATHPLRKQPTKFADRAAVIAAYTAVRAAHYEATNPNLKGNTMTKKASKTETAAAPAPAAKAKGKGKTAAAAPTPTPEVAAAPAPKGNGKAKDVSTDAAALADKATKKADGAKKSSRIINEGPFALGDGIGKAKSADELRMHEGSARYSIMAHCLSSKAKKFTLSELTEVAGDQTNQAIAVCLKKQYLVTVS